MEISVLLSPGDARVPQTERGAYHRALLEALSGYGYIKCSSFEKGKETIYRGIFGAADESIRYIGGIVWKIGWERKTGYVEKQEEIKKECGS